MDFCLTDEQIALQQGIGRFVDERCGLESIAESESTGAAVDRDRWAGLADMGVFSLLADGFDMRASVLVFEELGRGLLPGPLVSTFLAANFAPGQVDGADRGEAIVGLIEYRAHAGGQAQSADGGLEAPWPKGAAVVEHFAQVSHLLCLRSDGIYVLDQGTIEATELARPLDALSPVHLVRSAPHGERVADAASAQAARNAGTLLIAALQVGVASAATALANAYAKERHQFGRPIGGFQAVKHLLAEMLTKAEVARAAVHAAACVIDGASDASTSPQRAVSAAKIMGGDAAVFCGRQGIQVHGGMGFTWEVHAQRYWKRAVVLENSFGSSGDHALAIADTLVHKGD